jgi:NADPH2:quinone reductase
MKSYPAKMKAIIASEPGDARVLTLVERSVPEPGAGEVLLRVNAAGVNRPDIMQRQGLVKPPAGVTDVLGLEVCGEVVACGPGVPAYFQGRRLMSLVPGGGYAPWCVASVEHSFIVPDGLDDIAAAAMPEGLFTVWHNIFELGRLQMGETLLLHGASGGIGTLAIRMACAVGARVIATVGRSDRIAQLSNMGVSKVIFYKETDFVEACLDFTQGHGVDVVLDVVGGEYVQRNLKALAFGGRHVSLSFMQGSLVKVELLTLMQKQLSLHSSTMRPQPYGEKVRIAAAIQKYVLPLIARNVIRPLVHASFPLADAIRAHEMLERGDVFGKLVLLTGPEQ